MGGKRSGAALYVVATPIGNLGDLSSRAVEVLKAVDQIAAEDTRHTGVLLAHFGIATPMLALHEHNESELAPLLVERMQRGEALALVSDAGTPLLSDPGYRLVRAAIAAGIPVRPVPGASAVTAALSVAGLPTDRFVFEGFLPQRPGPRRAHLESLRSERRTLVFLEASHRIPESLEDLATVLGGNRQAAVCRELTKQFETVLRGSLAELGLIVAEDPNQQKGEFVLVVAGAEPDADASLARALELGRSLQEFMPLSQAARVAAKISEVSRRDLYRALERLTPEPEPPQA